MHYTLVRDIEAAIKELGLSELSRQALGRIWCKSEWLCPRLGPCVSMGGPVWALWWAENVLKEA